MFHRAPTPTVRRATAGSLIAAGLLALVCVATGSAQEPPRLIHYLGTLRGLNEPSSVAIASDESIWVADRGNHRVCEFTAAGVQKRTIGKRGDGQGEFLRPGGIAVAGDGRLCVADSGNRRLQLFDADANWLRTIPLDGPAFDPPAEPASIAWAGDRLLVVDGFAPRVLVLSETGELRSTLAPPPAPEGVRKLASIAAAEDGRVFVSDVWQNQLLVFGPDGKFVEAWGEWGSGLGLLACPVGIACGRGAVWVADMMNHRMQVFPLDGGEPFSAGLHALRPREGDGKLHYPNDVAIAPSGRFAAVCEGFENRVQLFGPLPPNTRPPMRIAGGADNISAAHFGPRVSLSGEYLAVAQPESHSVQVLHYALGDPTPVTDIGVFGSRLGTLNAPGAVLLESERGQLAVVDQANRRVQFWRLRLDPAGQNEYSLLLSSVVGAVSLDALGERVGLSLRWPFQIDALRRDRLGNWYALDQRNGVLALFDADWQRGRAIGGEPLRDLRCGADFVLDETGSAIYVSDADAACVRVYDLTGKPLRTLGGVEPERGGLHEPGGLALSEGGREIFIADRNASAVVVLDAEGAPLRRFGREGIGRGELFRPAGLAWDRRGTLLVLDHGNHRGVYFTAAGEFVAAFGPRLFVQPTRETGPRDAEDPADAALRPFPMRRLSNDGGYLVGCRIGATPTPMNDMFSLELVVLDAATRRPIDAAVSIGIDADMPEHRHGMNTRPKVAPGERPGVFQVSGMLFHMPGYWEIYVDLTRHGVTERAQFPVELK